MNPNVIEEKFLNLADEIIEVLCNLEDKHCNCDGEYVNGRAQGKECDPCKAKRILDAIFKC